jgi:hypothetical protein
VEVVVAEGCVVVVELVGDESVVVVVDSPGGDDLPGLVVVVVVDVDPLGKVVGGAAGVGAEPTVETVVDVLFGLVCAEVGVVLARGPAPPAAGARVVVVEDEVVVWTVDGGVLEAATLARGPWSSGARCGAWKSWA